MKNRDIIALEGTGTSVLTLFEHCTIDATLALYTVSQALNEQGAPGLSSGALVQIELVLESYLGAARQFHHATESKGSLDDGVLACIEDTLSKLRQLSEGGGLTSNLVSGIQQDITQCIVPALKTAIKDLRDKACSAANRKPAADLLTRLPYFTTLAEFTRKFAPDRAAVYDVSVMHIDIDKFKVLNRMSGYLSGDAAIRQVGEVIRAQLSDSVSAARIGFDEFVILFKGKYTEDALSEVAHKLQRAVSRPFTILDRECSTTVSIGIASGSFTDGLTLDDVLKCAETALQHVKRSRSANSVHFRPEMRSLCDADDMLKAEIISGISNGEFVPYFQPQVAGRSGKVAGMEMLVRWQHPRRGLLTPAEFLDVARTHKLLDRIDRNLTVTTLEVLRKWIATGVNVGSVSINLTATRLGSETIVSEFIDACAAANVPPQRINLEILESAMIDGRSESMIANAASLVRAGFHLELDDFGTSHASIANLRYLKVKRIKIDRSFIMGIHTDTDLSMIVAAMIGMAHNLRIDVLAEGVERPEERLILNALGCDYLQGFGISRPMSADQVPAWILKTAQPYRSRLLDHLKSDLKPDKS